MKYIKLNDNKKIPQIGLGTYKITERKVMANVIEAAFESGYEYIDTAKFYDNEDIIGAELKNSNKKREEYQLVTKVWPTYFGEDLTKKSIDESLENLQTDYIDIILLHWYGKDYDKAWKVFEEYKRQGIVKSIGVCNFEIKQLKELLKIGEAPVLDQLESSPHFQNSKTLEFLKENKIVHQAWSPLARGRSNLLEEDVIKNLSNKYNKTPAQIVLRWHIERGTMVIPKSSHPARIKENIDIFDFELSDDDMKAIKSLDIQKRYSNDPEDEIWLKELLTK
ncbi:aldo/keto reductase [Anaerococcus porci]|uniref:aldo/keto reductase n=1 Tax=Anaerococcus porci TaxID=2652269 RepID=UPI002A7597B0|nr:aldo/keto reductase [Anaerococcus porci]MDY3006418.1 aldo/keto reductase [Anaerococcus porci]